MGSKRRIFECLSKGELAEVIARYGLAVVDKRVREQLVGAVVSAQNVELADVLGQLSRDRLKEICGVLSIDQGGKEKTTLVARILGTLPLGTNGVSNNGQTKLPLDGPAPTDVRTPGEKSVSRKRGRNPRDTGGDLGFEAKLGQAADKLRNNMDAAEYKHEGQGGAAVRRSQKSTEDSSEAGGELILYQTEDGETRLQLRFADGTVWLTQKQLADLYQVSVPAISQHIKSIFDEGEVDAVATVKKHLTVRSEGNRSVSRSLDHYSLPIVLAIGYRVNSPRGTQFRQWATTQLGELLLKGFVMDDARLSGPPPAGAPDYFDELLERIRRIRASERRFYQKVTDVYATAVDYRNDASETQTFYATVQNKLHWAIHGHTAAEIIAERADADAPNMGLTNWAAGPRGSIRKSDVAVAKNYLSAEELSALERIVTMYLDFAEDQAARRKPMTMAEWAAKLDSFLQFNERNVLLHAGRIGRDLALERANAEYERYDAKVRQIEATQPTSDFDKLVATSSNVAKALPRGNKRGKKS